MAAIERIIAGLEGDKVNAAVEGLARPQTRDAFELGRLCGVQQGLAIAKKLVEEALRDEQSSEENDDGKRTQRR
jgi:hypothetical protein